MKFTIKTLAALHILLFVYSISGILSKTAAKQSFLSSQFLLLYGGIIFLLFFYAVGWQQILKRLPLTVAFSNKGVLLIWGMLWGVLFFEEMITWRMVAGCGLIILGMWLVVRNE